MDRVENKKAGLQRQTGFNLINWFILDFNS
jgi:hypothetical protein